MRVISYLILLIYGGCTIPNQETKKKELQATAKRYQVDSVEPPVVFEGAIALGGSEGNWPFIQMQTDENVFYADRNASYYYLDDSNGEYRRKMGLGLSTNFFVEPTVSRTKPFWIEKSSVIWEVVDNQLVEDRYYNAPRLKNDTIKITDNDLLDCRYSLKNGLECIVQNNRYEPEGSFITVWHDEKDPIIEITNRVRNGMYAMTKSGQLLYFAQTKTGILPVQRLHSDLIFTPNSQGRYFINAPSNRACMKTNEGKIYCAEISALEPGSKIYGLTNPMQPLLAQVGQPNFNVEEVAFGGRHFCLLSNDGEVWCKGDNGCGQVTGRYDGNSVIEDFERADFLVNKARQLFAHASGTCALLIDKRVQCFGLGASVIRKRILNDDVYRDSFRWVQGFRPWQVCMGGAEFGI